MLEIKQFATKCHPLRIVMSPDPLNKRVRVVKRSRIPIFRLAIVSLVIAVSSQQLIAMPHRHYTIEGTWLLKVGKVERPLVISKRDANHWVMVTREDQEH